MCKICVSCNGIMNYDPYFEAEVCGKCGQMERITTEEAKKMISYQSQNIEILKQIMVAMVARS